MKILLSLLILATLSAAVWTAYWSSDCGFFVFDSYYLAFKPQATEDKRFFPDFSQTCQYIFLAGVSPVWIVCVAWMAAAVVAWRRSLNPEDRKKAEQFQGKQET
jgi:hypothetical protein